MRETHAFQLGAVYTQRAFFRRKFYRDDSLLLVSQNF